jgi:hypothetical protein
VTLCSRSRTRFWCRLHVLPRTTGCRTLRDVSESTSNTIYTVAMNTPGKYTEIWHRKDLETYIKKRNAVTNTAALPRDGKHICDISEERLQGRRCGTTRLSGGNTSPHCEVRNHQASQDHVGTGPGRAVESDARLLKQLTERDEHAYMRRSICNVLEKNRMDDSSN